VWCQPRKDSETEIIRASARMRTVETLIRRKSCEDSEAGIVRASARMRTVERLARRKPSKDSKAEPVRVSAKSGTVKTPVRRKPCEDFETETVAISVEAGTAESQKGASRIGLRTGPRRSFGCVRGPTEICDEVCLQRGCLMARFRSKPTFRASARSGGFETGLKASLSSDGSPLVPGNGSDAQSSFPFLNPPKRKPCPTRAWFEKRVKRREIVEKEAVEE
jgi:hypothetical protein